MNDLILVTWGEPINSRLVAGPESHDRRLSSNQWHYDCSFIRTPLTVREKLFVKTLGAHCPRIRVSECALNNFVDMSS